MIVMVPSTQVNKYIQIGHDLASRKFDVFKTHTLQHRNLKSPSPIPLQQIRRH